jgi:hypothetical protein
MRGDVSIASVPRGEGVLNGCRGVGHGVEDTAPILRCAIRLWTETILTHLA